MARTSKVAGAEEQRDIDVDLGYKLMGPELQKQYAFFANLAVGSVASCGVSGSISETENFLKNNFKGYTWGIVILGDHHIMCGMVIINGESLSTQVGIDLNASLANQDFSDQMDVLGQVIAKAGFKTKLLRLHFWVIKEA